MRGEVIYPRRKPITSLLEQVLLTIKTLHDDSMRTRIVT